MNMVEMIARAMTSVRKRPAIIDPQAYEDANWQHLIPEACAAIEMIAALRASNSAEQLKKAELQ